MSIVFWGSSDKKNGIQKVENAYEQSTLHLMSILFKKLGRVEKVIGKIPAYNLCT